MAWIADEFSVLQKDALIPVVGKPAQDGGLPDSDRLIGRATAALIVRAAQNAGATRLRGTYLPSAKNQLVADLYQRLGFRLLEETPGGATRWEYDLAQRGPILNEFIAEPVGP